MLSKFSELSALVCSWLAEDGLLQSSTVLQQAASYALLSPGKRFRPVLVLSSAELLGVSALKVKNFALAIECVHAFSLVHDDLPCMDNDLFRRGQPTCHRKFGEATALLAGDMLVAQAFSLLSKGVSADISASWVELLSDAMIDLCDGQMMDLEAGGRGSLAGMSNDCGGLSPAEELALRHKRKTGALITASACGPTFFLSEESREETLMKLYQYSLNLGLLFQVTDDILEVTSSKEVLGKDTDSDARHGTPTYVSVYGLEKARGVASELADKACSALQGFSADTSFLEWLCDYALNRDH